MKTFLHIPISGVDPRIIISICSGGMPQSAVCLRIRLNSKSPSPRHISGNRTSLLVIIDLHLIVLVLLIIGYRAWAKDVGSCATHSNHCPIFNKVSLLLGESLQGQGRRL